MLCTHCREFATAQWRASRASRDAVGVGVLCDRCGAVLGAGERRDDVPPPSQPPTLHFAPFKPLPAR